MKNLVKALKRTRSKHLIKALGTYYKTIRIHNKDVEVFVDPSRKEMLELINQNLFKEFRFIADDVTKKVYIWDAETLHDAMYQELKSELRGKTLRDRSLLKGIAGLEDGKIAVTHIFAPYKKPPVTQNWEWLNHYFNIDKYLV